MYRKHIWEPGILIFAVSVFVCSWLMFAQDSSISLMADVFAEIV